MEVGEAGLVEDLARLGDGVLSYAAFASSGVNVFTKP
jgi:hypothetical protein